MKKLFPVMQKIKKNSNENRQGGESNEMFF